MQKIMKKYRKAQGFTLVELLIVVIIIGILAGMMMLSSGSATDKAEAAKIIANMRTIKSASLMFYADNDRYPTTGELAETSFDKYMDSKIDTDKYKFDEVAEPATMGDGDALVVYYDADAAGTTTGVLKKLAGMAKESGLFKSDLSAEYDGSSNPYMIIKKDI